MSVVETSTGRIRGRVRGATTLFSGVPYAAPPTGRRRFRGPEPHPGWAGVREADQFGPASVQMPDAYERKEATAEDCLYLNIETPGADDARRPVLVWIHGGGFVVGGGSFVEYRGTAFASNGDLVFVSMNYRLGALGWLHLSHRFDDFSESANCGLLDQVAALEWVRENIAAFGGDPSRITLCGQSAGAISIGAMIQMPEVRGLPAAAIMQSGTPEHLIPAPKAATFADWLLADMGIDNVDDLLRASADSILQSQMHLMATDFERSLDPASALTFGPVHDGQVLPPTSSVGQAVEQAPIPLLIGSNLDEQEVFARAGFPPDEVIIERLSGQVDDPEQLLATYRASSGSARAAWSALWSDALYRLPAVRTAERWTQAGGLAYRYLFAWRPPGAVVGAVHSREIPFVFGALGALASGRLAGPEPDPDLEDAMHRSWTAFVHHHDPNHPGLPEWSPYGLRRSTMVFDAPSRAVDDPDADIRARWGGGSAST